VKKKGGQGRKGRAILFWAQWSVAQRASQEKKREHGKGRGGPRNPLAPNETYREESNHTMGAKKMR